jgi:protein-L-isoaspartate O-methyltransferase
MPVGERGSQQLVLINKTAQGCEQQLISAVSFVPLLGGTE